MSNITVDKVVEAYTITRDEIADLEAKAAELKHYQQKREEWLATTMQEMGVENMRTPHGMAYTTVFESVTVADAEAFFEWCKQNDKWECMERRANKKEVLHIMGDKGDGGRPNVPPAGVNYTAVRKTHIRK